MEVGQGSLLSSDAGILGLPPPSGWLSLGRKDEVSWSQGSNVSLTAAFLVQFRLRSEKF